MKEVNKMKFVVMKGRDGTPGSVRCDYSIFDVIEVNSKNIKNEFKNILSRNSVKWVVMLKLWNRMFLSI